MSRLFLYRLADGVFTGTHRSITKVPPEIPGHEWFAATDGIAVDWQAQRVDLETGELVDYQPPPPADTEFETWSWDADSRRWVATPTAAAHWRVVREERDRRLRDSDWRVIAATERAERPSKAWLEYRQALRDITTQPDPLAIQWPEKPE